MTFEQFQASRQEIDDVSLAERHAGLEDGEVGDPGFVYATGLFISKVTESWPAKAREEGAYYLIISNLDWISDDLAHLERILYDSYACELNDSPEAVVS